MNWICSTCGRVAKTNRQKCTRCGSLSWKPAPKKDLMELSGPTRRIATTGLRAVDVAKQAKASDNSSRSIVCGKCQTVIYMADKDFDSRAFQEAKKKHYLTSPTCEEHN